MNEALLYNMEIRDNEPAIAIQKTSFGIGREFCCYDRMEIEASIEFMSYYGGPHQSFFGKYHSQFEDNIEV